MTRDTFLKDFWDPLVLLEKEKWIKIDNMWFGKNEKVGIIVEKNYRYPSRVVFTPNGNFKTKSIWNTTLAYSKKIFMSWPIYNTFYCSVTNKSKEEIQSIAKKTDLVPTYIVKKSKWYDLYWNILKKDRKNVEILIKDYWYRIINEWFIDIFWGDANTKASSSTLASCLLPETVDWTGWKRTTTKIEDYSAIYYRYKDIENIYNYMNDKKKIEKEESKYFKVRWEKVYNYLMGIDIREIIGHLEGKDIKINKEWKILHEWDIVEWYIYDEEKNYVYCFSDDYYSIVELPRWGPYSFVYYYYWESHPLAQKFFKEIFSVDIEWGFYKEKEYIIETLESPSYMLEFTNLWVYLIPKIAKKKVKTILFRDKVEIQGIGYLNDNSQIWFEQAKWGVIFMAKINNWDTEIFRIYSTRQEFNKRYIGKTFFYAWDNEMAIFFDIIQKSWNYKEIRVIADNWIYDDVTVLWWEVIRWEKDRDTEIVVKEKYNIINNTTTIKPAWYFDKLCKVMDKEVSIPIFLQSLALAGMNLWENKTVYPWLLITGKTGSGKSTLSDMIKKYLWYAVNSRKYWLPTITAQPLSIYSSDQSILFLEELTEEVSLKTEELIRNIINRDVWGRWLGNWNIYYNYRSPLFITWERTFKEESLNNRVVVVNLQKKHQVKWWVKHIKELEDLCWVEYIYSKYMKNKNKINVLYEKYNKKISKKFESRYSDVRSYMFVANEIFNVWIPEEEIIASMEKSLRLLWFLNKEKETDWLHDLSVFLIRGVFQKKMIYCVSAFEKKEVHWFIFTDDRYIEMIRTKIRYLAEDINSNIQKESVFVSNYEIKVIIESEDYVLKNVMENIQSVVGKRSFNYQRVYTWNEEL